MVPIAALEKLEPMQKIVSRADGIRGEFRLVTMASIPWTSPECWRHQSDCSIHIITTFKGGRVMIAFFVNYSTVAFPLHLPTLKRQQFFGAVADSLGKKFIFPATVGRAALCGANR